MRERNRVNEWKKESKLERKRVNKKRKRVDEREKENKWEINLRVKI